jgi:TRAP-type uncharacterized transport system fused permease subunit
MGMGLPATAAYVIAATIGVPPLIAAGITPIAANMFVLYFAIISFITPPVAIAAYAAAGISGANSMRTGLQAFLLGLSGFIIPFIYAYNPALLILDSSAGATIYITIMTIFAIFLLSVALIGWLKGRVNNIFRLLLVASSVLLFIQGNRVFDYLGLGLGVLTIGLILFMNIKKGKKDRVLADS